jgi:transglutaminase-like putative cysteine protease
MSRRTVGELSLVAVALIGAAAVGRLTTAGAAWRGVVVTAIVGEAVTALFSRRLSAAGSAIAGTAAVAVTAVWISVPAGARWHGLPSVTTLRVLDHALRSMGPVHFPLAGGPGVVLICALVAGVAGVGTRALPGALGLLPALALLAASTATQASGGAALLAVALTVAGICFMVARSAERVGALLGTVTAVATLGAVVVVSLVTATGPASGGGALVAGVPPTALSLVARLTAFQIRDPDLMLFTAVSPLPTYWQVGSLSVLSGQTWVPDPATAAALAGTSTPALSGPPPGGRTFTASITVNNLSSRLLPVPPSTTGVSEATLTAVGAVASTPSSPGLHYTATATVPETVVGNGGALAAAGPPSTPDVVDTQLPSLPPAVAELARSITASASTPLEKAEALTNWFRSRLFHYALRPTGATLITFLMSSHTGSCEQFAGAYAVLARAVGLPTRVAVGFTPGVRDSAGQTVVRGIDAHAWPEVLLGGSWISFEPTPERPSGELSPPGVIGVSGVGDPNPIAPTTLPRSLPGLSFPVPAHPVVVPAVASGAGAWWAALPVGVVLIAVTTTLVIRRRRRRRLTPDEQLLMAWTRIDRALARRDMARPPWRTPVDHTRLLRSEIPDPEMSEVLQDIAWLADAMEKAAYGSKPADTDDAGRAREVGRRVAKALATTSGGR